MLADRRPTGTGSPGESSLITNEQIPDFYDALSRYVQVMNWISYRDRFAYHTMHKRLAIPQADGSEAGRRAGLEYVNDRLLEVADLAPRARVLDAGCGFGGTIFHWHRRRGGSYDGLTLSRVQLGVARREAKRRGIAQACRFHLRSYDQPLRQEFEAVVAIESLIHSADLGRTLGNLTRALRPGGLLLILDDMAEEDLEATRPAESALLRDHWGCSRFHTHHDYLAALDAACVSVIHQEDLSPLMRPRRQEVLDRLAPTYSRLHSAAPLRFVRTVASAYLGGIALERLHDSGEVHYRLIVARSPGTGE